MHMQAIPSLPFVALKHSAPDWQGSSAESHLLYAPAVELVPALVGESLAARRLRTQVARVAPYLRIALVAGESGCGKQQVARALHDAGPQRDGPFVACAAAAFAEALFGERSAEDAQSLLESAQGGTLYLHGIEDLAYPLQGALQRFLGEREAGRGAQTVPAQWRSSEVRIIAGTRRDLRTASSIGQFRADLFARLSVLKIRVPALHERTEDLPALAENILHRASRRTGLAPKVLSPGAVEKLTGREWGGNLKELEQAIVHASVLAHGPVIEAAHLPPFEAAAQTPAVPAAYAADTAPAGERLQDVIQRHVVGVLTACRGNKLRASEILGISRSTLYRMLDAGSFVPETETRGR